MATADSWQALAEIWGARPLRVIVAGDLVGAGALTLDRLIGSAPAGVPPVETHADEVAFWLYTSGSTGRPKTARHLHPSPALTAPLHGQGVLGIDATDVVYSAAKLFIAYGLGNAISFPLSVGATAVLLPDRPGATAWVSTCSTVSDRPRCSTSSSPTGPARSASFW